MSYHRPPWWLTEPVLSVGVLVLTLMFSLPVSYGLAKLGHPTAVWFWTLIGVMGP